MAENTTRQQTKWLNEIIKDLIYNKNIVIFTKK